MTKAIPKTGSRRYSRIRSRRYRNIRSRSHKNVRRITKGIIHVQAGWNNTTVAVTDVQGQVVSWSSAGTCKFKGPRKGTPYAAQVVAVDAIRWLVTQGGMKRAEVRIKGGGLGRDAALRAIHQSGIRITVVRDVTPLPHNGCRPPKKRRV
uniref:Ribosomal protein S11 n=2 Tax=Orchidantha TaxID=4657 RepID=U6A2K5_9LILI|nr:ribosomal protein S11 [Orchidantha fimbriata]AYP34388.1 ribosomal protein S11 [Orchidantha fimbriata]AYP34458.1 ribosomal protein S11 [Orchidantha maxillarioides]